MSNPYFAYSIRQGFEPAPITLPPIQSSKSSKKIFRACDACSVRKTKCDESRPCRHCVNNKLQCTDLRQRKKSGPKSLRKKTIESINGVGTPSPPLRARSRASGSPTDFSEISSEISSLSPEIFDACVPFTVPSFAQNAASLVASNSQSAEDSLLAHSKTFAIVTLALVAKEMFKLMKSEHMAAEVIEKIQWQVSSSMSICNELILFHESPENISFDERYYLLLAELHLFSYLHLRGQLNTQKFLHLKAAITHYQQLAVDAQANSVRFIEIHRTLFVWERHNVLFGEEHQFRAAELMVFPLERQNLDTTYLHPLLDSYYDLLVMLENMSVFREQIPEPFCWIRKSYSRGSNLHFSQVKSNLSVWDEASNQVPDVFEVMKALVLGVKFKVLLLCSRDMDQTYLSHELFEIITTFNYCLSRASGRLKVYMESLLLTSCLSEVLGAFSQVTPLDSINPVIKSTLLEASSYSRGKGPQVDGF